MLRSALEKTLKKNGYDVVEVRDDQGNIELDKQNNPKKSNKLIHRIDAAAWDKVITRVSSEPMKTFAFWEMNVLHDYKWNAEAPTKWLWGVTIANIASLLLAFIFVVAAFASIVSLWSLLILLLLGIALSVTGFILSKGVVSRDSRFVVSIINGSVLAFQLLIVLGLAAVWLLSGKLSYMH
jgi:hypothetical protein